MPTSIFNMPSASSTSPPPKIHVTHSQISSKYLDPTQPPTKTNPFQQINGIPFVRDLRICMPLRVWDALYPEHGTSSSPKTSDSLPVLQYSKVSMTLKDILDNEDLRRGNYLFLSTPSSSQSADVADTTIALSRGTLTITMPQHIYQRSGLTFPTTKVLSGSRKHDPRAMRYRVELDLRSTSMVRGKKGFDRIMYAAKNFEGLCEVKEWWLYDFGDGGTGAGTKKRKRGTDEEDQHDEGTRNGADDDGQEEAQSKAANDENEHPLSKLNPAVKKKAGDKSVFRDVLLSNFLRDPSFFSEIHPRGAPQHSQKGNLPTILEEDIYDIVEYLSLLFLQSPRITKSQYGQIDSYLCQYVLPDVLSSSSTTTIHNPNDPSGAGEIRGCSEDLIIVSYSGFIPSEFVTQILANLLRKSRSTQLLDDVNEVWAALNAIAQPTEVTGSPDGLTIFLQGSSQALDKKHEGAVGHDFEDSVLAEQGADHSGSNKVESDHHLPRGFRHVTCFEFVDDRTG